MMCTAGDGNCLVSKLPNFDENWRLETTKTNEELKTRCDQLAGQLDDIKRAYYIMMQEYFSTKFGQRSCEQQLTQLREENALQKMNLKQATEKMARFVSLVQKHFLIEDRNLNRYRRERDTFEKMLANCRRCCPNSVHTVTKRNCRVQESFTRFKLEQSKKLHEQIVRNSLLKKKSDEKSQLIRQFRGDVAAIKGHFGQQKRQIVEQLKKFKTQLETSKEELREEILRKSLEIESERAEKAVLLRKSELEKAKAKSGKFEKEKRIRLIKRGKQLKKLQTAKAFQIRIRPEQEEMEKNREEIAMLLLEKRNLLVKTQEQEQRILQLEKIAAEAHQETLVFTPGTTNSTICQPNVNFPSVGATTPMITGSSEATTLKKRLNIADLLLNLCEKDEEIRQLKCKLTQ